MEKSENGPVMLALSSFRLSEKVIKAGIELAVQNGTMILVYIIDENIHRYIAGAGIGVYPSMSRQLEKELIEHFRNQAESEIALIEEKARKDGVRAVETVVKVGRFGIECTLLEAQKKPSVIVTTRSKRPVWLRKMFGSPVDYIIKNAGCRVVEV